MTREATGILDSGIGGLSVQRHLAHTPIIYISDPENAPYGNKSPSQILQHCQDLIPHIQKQPIKLLIIACHTICTIALPLFRSTLSIPVIAITEQALLSVQSHPTPQRLAILATQATIQSNFYQQALSHLTLFPTPCPNFATLVEQKLTHDPIAYETAHQYLSPLISLQPTAILLACTHYPFLSHAISNILPNIPLIDPALQVSI